MLFYKILRCKWCNGKLLPNRFHTNGHARGLHYISPKMNLDLGGKELRERLQGLQAVHSLSSDVTIVYCKMIYKVTILAVSFAQCANERKNIFFFLAELKVCKITKS